MLTLTSPQVVQETALRWKKDGKKIAFVPTMGALHDGHLKLVEAAKALGNKVIVSIFVNPLQFGPTEDLKKYPRPIESDSAKLEKLEIDVLFHPSEKEFYPEHFSTRVNVSKLTDALCGNFRPGHFEGVATVCLKLFQITQADFAIFGEKDFQQLRVLQQLASDLNLPLAVVPHPILRDADGLALSSRNAYLSSEQREKALKLSAAGRAAMKRYFEYPRSTVKDVLSTAAAVLEVPGIRIEYLELASENNLTPATHDTLISDISFPRLFMAAWVGETRLIDNQPLDRRSDAMDAPENIA